MIYFFQCLMNTVCKLNIFDYISFRSCSKPLRNVDHLTLDVPFNGIDVVKNSFFVRICRLLNELPLIIRESNTLSTFLKTLMAFYCDKFHVDFFLILHCTLLNHWAIYGNFLSILFIPCLL